MGAELNLEAIPLTALVFWLIYITGTGAALLYPLTGVLLYILVYHLHPETQWWGHSIRAIGLRTSMTVAVAIVIGILARRPRFGPGGRQFPLPFALSITLVLLALGIQFATGHVSVAVVATAFALLFLMTLLFLATRLATP